MVAAITITKDFVDALTGFIGGVGGVILLLMPGYILTRVFSRGIPGPEISDNQFM